MSAPATAVRHLRAGTRASRLARHQTDFIARELERRTGIGSTEVLLTTAGDQDTATPLPALGGRGVFTGALERELLAGSIDYAVHSLKDVPVDPTPGLILAAIGFREDPRDLLLSRARWTLGSLPRDARVGTCSVRRSAQLLAPRPDLEIRPLRGNVDTRVARVRDGEYDAIVLAAAGLARLGLAADISVPLPLDRVVPAPGQAALAVQCREDNAEVRAWLSRLDDAAVRAATDAERGFLEGLGGGCLAPIAAHAVVSEGTIALHGVVSSADGREMVSVHLRAAASDGRGVGLRLAEEAVARGALELL